MKQTLFDLAEWRTKLEPEIHGPNWDWLSDSPEAIVRIEDLRRRAERSSSLGERVPTEVFTFGIGEPNERHVTKVNGLPYRPAGRPWPVDCSGRPLTFLAQLCFAESHVQFGKLPGDVLLVFVRTSRASLRPVEGIDLGSFVFEWYPLGLSDLVSEEDVVKPPPLLPGPFQVADFDEQGDPLPAPPFVFPTCFGVGHQSWDYFQIDRVIESTRNVLPPPPEDFADDPEFEAALRRCIGRFAGTKIGGLPFWYTLPGPNVSGKFLGSFAGVRPSSDAPFPWTNVEGPIYGDDAYLRENSLTLSGWCSCMNLFLKHNGEIEWHIDSDMNW